MFKYRLLAFGFTGVFFIFATSCNSNQNKTHNSESTRLDGAAIISNLNLTTPQRAEELAKIAEQLLTAQGFIYAVDLANQALLIDPKNLRAQFIKAILGPLVAQKGILARIAPLAAQDPVLKSKYEKMLAEIEGTQPNSSIKTHLMGGSPDIKDEADIQKYFDEIIDSFDKLRSFAKSHKNDELTLMVPDAFYHSMYTRWSSACIVELTGRWQYELKCPSQVSLMELSFNQADFEGLQQLAAGFEVYFIFHNSYDLTGLIEVARKHRKDTVLPPADVLWSEMLLNSKFATLRQTNGFTRIKDIGSDALDGMSWVLKNQTKLCPLGKEDPRNRLNALLNMGICIDQESLPQKIEDLKKARAVMAGGTIDLHFWDNSGIYSTQLRPAAWLNNPISDFRLMMPMHFGTCHNLLSISETTFGGLLPNGDANKILPLISKCEKSFLLEETQQ